MSFRAKSFHFFWTGFFLLFLFSSSSSSNGGAGALNSDGILLLSFKYSVLSDPSWVLENWNYDDETPCSWNGVLCSKFPSNPDNTYRVVSLVLPDSKLLGSIPSDLFMIQHLQILDLSNNFFNGSLPISLFNASSQLKILSLSNNEISGQLPEMIGELKNLESLNLSDNAFTGNLPRKLTSLTNLSTISLSNNYFIGDIPSGFQKVEFLDLSSNLINGSLPSDFGGDHLRYLNLSYNRISGEIPSEFANRIPVKATLDFKFNNLTGEIPDDQTLVSQKGDSFIGNLDLCGKPVKNPCKIPSTLSILPNVSDNTTTTTTTTTSPPAIAAIPRTIDSTPATGTTSNGSDEKTQTGLRPGTIVGIVIGDLAGIGILSMVFLYLYRSHKKAKKKKVAAEMNNKGGGKPNSRGEGGGLVCSCLRNKTINGEETSEITTSSDTEPDEEMGLNQKQPLQQPPPPPQLQKNSNPNPGSLVTVDGETELELETLLKASAYILGTTGSSIVYKAVLEDGTALAVRRIGEIGVERFRDFENQVRAIAKLRHPNLVRIRAFYWGSDEKLIIYDHVSNGNLASATYRRPGSSPYHLPWEVRLRIARGVARGLAYLHEKKHVHGNLKTTNILLGPDMDPKISDFGLEKLMWGDTSYKGGGSARHFGSKRSTISRESLQLDLPAGASPSTSSMGGGGGGGASPYHAPESLKTLKPNAKWDVYSFGIVLLELLTGKIFSENELSHWNNINSVAVAAGGGGVLDEEERSRVLRMADLAIRADVEGMEDALMSCFKLGFSCVNVIPTKRPSMKEVQQVLERIPFSSSSHHALL